ncbi:MAG: oligopeptide transporter, OPT family [Sodaliphilus sp.]|nr:oligopeptide transporter, OPT family [Bacteroidales bacterium]MDY3683443.1 oligopeptide transporter, OPT family [Sodaliphilus sp.]MCI6577484.1 oligopeptide transporter, OPT family [Bacteroidales bacterium]MCI6656311.1 oligopeptide transporter, OPT family [Bacteroidales bacterium]MCI7470255.1 oligopeptide transporter, OPT family [Bacteroidales bacterium]
MNDEVQESMSLPENAFTELKPGEEYVPPMRPDKTYPEATGYSVSMGLIMAVIFSAAAAYLGLKVGQVFEAAIPIAIIAAGIAGVTKRKNSLGENVIIQSIGAASGIVVAGAIFTLPALYILQAKYPEITVNFLEVFLSSLLGGLLGILFFIPFRKYFVKDMHGKFPFPEATATTQVLISGQKGGSQAKPLLMAGLVGGLYDFFLSTFGWWKEVLSTQAIPALQTFTHNTKMMFSINTGSAVLGLGYIVGLRYAFIIFAGSAFIWWCIVPLLGSMVPEMAEMAPDAIFKDYARSIGIGGIAMSGVIGIIKSWGVIKSAVGLAGKSFSNKGTEEKPVRTQKDISMKLLVFALTAALIITFVFFWIGVIGNLTQAIVAFFVVVVIAFLFTTVAANAIAIVGSNPVSGMTLMTLIVASTIFVAIGLNGTQGIIASMVIGGVVCTALSMAGGMVTDMKIGYWLGSTPAKQQTWKAVGTLVSAATVGGVILLLNKAYGFTNPDVMAAPQANAMAAVIDPLMMGGDTPWILYSVGAVFACLLNWLGVPALAFSLGMFIPFHLNAPLLVGGAISWFVGSRSKDEKLNKARQEKGTLLASGFIAGGALMGVVSAGMTLSGFSYECPLSDGVTSALAVVIYLALIGFLICSCLKAKKED